MISKLDLHVHSKYSYDSIMHPDKIVKVAKRKGLSGVALTDHGTIRGGVLAKKQDKDFLVIVGAEIKTEIGDVIGLFLNEEIKSKEALSVIDEIKEQDGIVVLPHPFRDHTNSYDKKFLKRIDAIEGFNARSEIETNVKAQILAKNNLLPLTAGSDAHFYGEIGLAKIIINEIVSEESVKRSILTGKTVVEGTQTPIYYLGGSRILTDVKKGRLYRLPYSGARISIKGTIKLFKKMRK